MRRGGPGLSIICSHVAGRSPLPGGATHMSIRNDSRSLLATFDSLARAHTRPWIGAPRVPFLVIGLIVLLIAGLFVALVVEERHVNREAMSRDIDAAARQLGLRLDGLGEALAAIAFDLNDPRDEEQHFREQATELLASRRACSTSIHVAACLARSTRSRLLVPSRLSKRRSKRGSTSSAPRGRSS